LRNAKSYQVADITVTLGWGVVMHQLVGMGEMRRMGEMREMREKIYLNLPHLPHLPHLHSWQKDFVPLSNQTNSSAE